MTIKMMRKKKILTQMENHCLHQIKFATSSMQFLLTDLKKKQFNLKLAYKRLGKKSYRKQAQVLLLMRA